MSYATIEVKAVTPLLGAEIAGVDLAAAERAAGRRAQTALAQHQVLFFRDQKHQPGPAEGFGRQFGDLHIHPNTPGPAGHPEILPIHADANSKRIAGERWHSDVSCDQEPPMGSILYLHTVRPVGGDTLFASMYAAYDALSPRMQGVPRRADRDAFRRPVYRRTNRLLGIDDREPGVSAGGASGGAHASGDRPQGAVRQREFHRPHQELSEDESEADAGFLYAHRAAGVPGALSLAADTRSRSGTTARCSTSRCGITSRKSDPAPA